MAKATSRKVDKGLLEHHLTCKKPLLSSQNGGFKRRKPLPIDVLQVKYDSEMLKHRAILQELRERIEAIRQDIRRLKHG